MKLVDDNTKQNLNNMYSIVIVDEIENKSKINNMYSDFIISIYDHCLTDFEAEKYIISFSMSDDLTRNKYMQKEKLYIELFEKIYCVGNVYKVVVDDSDTISFFEYDTLYEFIYDCIKSLRELELIQICLPEFEAMLVGNYDLENIVYFKNCDKIVKLKQLVTNAGLLIRE